jgi:hypothetical protein
MYLAFSILLATWAVLYLLQALLLSQHDEVPDNFKSEMEALSSANKFSLATFVVVLFSFVGVASELLPQPGVILAWILGIGLGIINYPTFYFLQHGDGEFFGWGATDDVLWGRRGVHNRVVWRRFFGAVCSYLAIVAPLICAILVTR